MVNSYRLDDLEAMPEEPDENPPNIVPFGRW